MCKSYSHFFSKKFRHIWVSLDVNFNESLTNDVISFEQLGPGILDTSTGSQMDLLTFWDITKTYLYNFDPLNPTFI